MEIEMILLLTHVIGTIIGVGGATMIEVHLNMSMRDKTLSTDERSILSSDYTIVRVGLVIAILSGFGLLLYHRLAEHYGVMFNPILWAKLLIVLIIAANTLLLQAKKISIYWGSAFSFVSWWIVALIGVFMTERADINLFGGETFIASFGSILIIYAFAVVLGAIVLHGIRNKISSSV